MAMLRQILKELLIVTTGTLLFLMLCASVGISTSEYNDAPIVIADEQVPEPNKLGIDQPPDGMDRAFSQGIE